jgi:tristetraprolin/butyrate response factor 1
MEPVTQSPVTAHNDSPPLGAPRTSSRASGHTRSGSAGNWNTSSRSNLRDYRTAGPDGKPSAPWLTDISSGSSRLQEQTWG